MDGFDKIKFGDDSPECTYPVHVHRSQPDHALLGHGRAVHACRAHVHDPGQRQLYRTPGSDRPAPASSRSVRAMVDLPTCGGTLRLGLRRAGETHTHSISARTKNSYPPVSGPFPCTNHTPSSFPTLRDLLDAASVSWKYYVPPGNVTAGRLFSAFDAIAPVRYGPEWATNVISPETRFTAISNGQLHARGYAGHGEFGPSGRTDDERPGVGRERRQRDRRKPILEIDGGRDRLGRLGRPVRQPPPQQMDYGGLDSAFRRSSSRPTRAQATFRTTTTSSAAS